MAKKANPQTKSPKTGATAKMNAPKTTKAVSIKPAKNVKATPSVAKKMSQPSKAVEVKATKKVKKKTSNRHIILTVKVLPADTLQVPILDNEPVTIETTKFIRYSDEELKEFKQHILNLLSDARKLLTELNGYVKDDDMRDQREDNTRLASRQVQYIAHLEKALIRIENKTYGVCSQTGQLIPKARLMAVPHATLSIEAKNKQPEKRRTYYSHPSNNNVKTLVSI